MNTQIFPIAIEVKALVWGNPNFSPNTNAVELVAEMIKDAKANCFRSLRHSLAEPNKNFENYIEGKIKAYEAMKQSLIKNQSWQGTNSLIGLGMKKFTIIYVDSWQSGSHQHSLTRMQRVLAPDIHAVMRSAYGDKSQFIFDGFPILNGEDVENGYSLPIVELHDAPTSALWKPS
jgi:hypothetical protein